jgi:hypothetical protein
VDRETRGSVETPAGDLTLAAGVVVLGCLLLAPFALVEPLVPEAVDRDQKVVSEIVNLRREALDLVEVAVGLRELLCFQRHAPGIGRSVAST